MFNMIKMISTMGWVVPNGNQLTKALYIRACGNTYKDVYLKTGVSHRRIKKHLRLSQYGVNKRS